MLNGHADGRIVQIVLCATDEIAADSFPMYPDECATRIMLLWWYSVRDVTVQPDMSCMHEMQQRLLKPGGRHGCSHSLLSSFMQGVDS
jgi:hypothetical protein